MAEESKTVNAVAKEGKQSKWNENTIEILVAVLLGVTALLMAWASWISSLHGGVQATNYTKSNNLASEGNSEYNAAVQLYLSDTMVWNTMMEYMFDLEIAEAENNQVRADLINAKLESYADQNASEILLDGLKWMDENNAVSPFEMPGILDQYFVTANELLTESQELLEEGQRDNAKGDAYNLVSVIYSLVLFLLGIVSIFKRLPNRGAVLILAAVILVLTTIYMCTLPLPTGFNLGNIIGLK